MELSLPQLNFTGHTVRQGSNGDVSSPRENDRRIYQYRETRVTCTRMNTAERIGSSDFSGAPTRDCDSERSKAYKVSIKLAVYPTGAELQSPTISPWAIPGPSSTMAMTMAIFRAIHAVSIFRPESVQQVIRRLKCKVSKFSGAVHECSPSEGFHLTIVGNSPQSESQLVELVELAESSRPQDNQASPRGRPSRLNSVIGTHVIEAAERPDLVRFDKSC